MRIKNKSEHEIFYSTISAKLNPGEEKTVTSAEGKVYLSNPYVVEIKDELESKVSKKK